MNIYGNKSPSKYILVIYMVYYFPCNACSLNHVSMCECGIRIFFVTISHRHHCHRHYFRFFVCQNVHAYENGRMTNVHIFDMKESSFYTLNVFYIIIIVHTQHIVICFSDNEWCWWRNANNRKWKTLDLQKRCVMIFIFAFSLSCQRSLSLSGVRRSNHFSSNRYTTYILLFGDF